jgi:hypothetical protein
MHPPPDARLLIATGCSHCPIMLENLVKRVKDGTLGRLEIINISNQAETATRLGVRSVPWCQIGDYTFDGMLNPEELSGFIDQFRRGKGENAYLIHLLQRHRLDEASERIGQTPYLLAGLIPLLGDLQEPMALRIGIGALLEGLPQAIAQTHASGPLQALLQSDEPQVRADACHYLGTTGDDSAIDQIRRLLHDDNREVSEIAAETLAVLHAHH